jgi:hypothetical protein
VVADPASLFYDTKLNKIYHRYSLSIDRPQTILTVGARYPWIILIIEMKADQLYG